MGNAARNITWISVLVNLCLAAAKFLAGHFGHSQAVTADAAHSLTDLISDAALLVGMRYWSRPQDRDHPYGHGRIETLVTACLGIGLGATGIGLGYRAIRTMPSPHGHVGPGSIALIAALVSIVVKEILYHVTVRVGRRAKSSAVVANAWHHRSDALSSIPTALAVSGAMLLPRLQVLDRVGAILVCLLILKAAWRIALPAAGQLVDTAPPQDVRDSIMHTIRKHHEVKNAHVLRTRYVGAGVAVDFHIHVDPEITVREGHDIAEHLKAELMQTFPDIADVIVHVEPRHGER